MTRPMYLTPDEAWPVIDRQRLALADVLDGLTEPEWRRPSLCHDWTVRDVTGHLTLQHFPITLAIAETIRARGNLDRAIRDSSRRRAQEPTERLIARIRGMVGSRRHVPGMTYHEALIDHLVHGQDITVPLGRPLEIPPAAAAAAATRTFERHEKMFHARTRFAGFRLVASDVDWSAGEGSEVQAPMTALLLLVTGRTAALPQLSGAGAAELAVRLSAPA